MYTFYFNLSTINQSGISFNNNPVTFFSIPTQFHIYINTDSKLYLCIYSFSVFLQKHSVRQTHLFQYSHIGNDRVIFGTEIHGDTSKHSRTEPLIRVTYLNFNGKSMRKPGSIVGYITETFPLKTSIAQCVGLYFGRQTLCHLIKSDSETFINTLTGLIFSTTSMGN